MYVAIAKSALGASMRASLVMGKHLPIMLVEHVYKPHVVSNVRHSTDVFLRI